MVSPQARRQAVDVLLEEHGFKITRRRKRKRMAAAERKPLPKPTSPSESWSMDFVSDWLTDGRRLRCLTIVDDCSRECPAIEVDTAGAGPLRAGRRRDHGRAAAHLVELRLLAQGAHRAGQSGVEAGRFDTVPADAEEFIPLPEKEKYP